MIVYQEVWHRIRPLTAKAYQQFVDFYGRAVVEPNLEMLDVLGGWKYTSGQSNSDFTLYRFASLGKIGETLGSFGMDDEYLREVEALFAATYTEEFRKVAVPAPYVNSDQLEALLTEKPATPRRYLRVLRDLPQGDPTRTYDALAKLVEAREKAGALKLVTAYETIIGTMSEMTELWVLPQGVRELDPEAREPDPTLAEQVNEIAPENERYLLDPLSYSRLR